MPEQYMAQGWGGVPKDTATQDALLSMTDTAKKARLAATRQNLNSVFGQGEPTAQAHEALAAANAANAVADVDPEDIGAKVTAMDKRADALEKEAEMVQKSGTGNYHAQQTYLKAAAILRNKARQIHAQWMESITQQAQAQQQQMNQQQQPMGSQQQFGAGPGPGSY
jgi:hypothetical protein